MAKKYVDLTEVEWEEMLPGRAEAWLYWAGQWEQVRLISVVKTGKGFGNRVVLPCERERIVYNHELKFYKPGSRRRGVRVT